MPPSLPGIGHGIPPLPLFGSRGGGASALMDLRASALKDDMAVNEFYGKVVSCIQAMKEQEVQPPSRQASI